MAEARRETAKLGLVGWAMFDWANSAFPTVIVTFVFATYYAGAVAADPISGASSWSYALALSGLGIAILGPVFGAVSDKAGRRKPWTALFSLVCIAATAALAGVAPDPSYALLALVLVGIANLGFEIAIIFNNAMLPEIAPPGMIGRISGWAWGLGYGGGLACLLIILVAFDTSSLDQVRLTSLLVAAWYAVFTIPLWLWTPDIPASGLSFGRAVQDGIAMLWHTLRHIRGSRNIALYLLAHMIYGDGLATLFAMGGVFAQSAFGMSTAEVLQFAVALNVTAGLGAAAFGWVDDRIGPKRTILISLAGLVVTGALILALHDKMAFLIAGSALGVFIGPAQAASRSLLARLVPEGQETEMFGLYAFSDKATSFLGPALFGLALELTGNARAGIATILGFFLIGAALLAGVREPR